MPPLPPVAKARGPRGGGNLVVYRSGRLCGVHGGIFGPDNRPDYKARFGRVTTVWRASVKAVPTEDSLIINSYVLLEHSTGFDTMK